MSKEIITDWSKCAPEFSKSEFDCYEMAFFAFTSKEQAEEVFGIFDENPLP